MAADRNRDRADGIMGVGSKTRVASVDQSWKICTPSHPSGLLAMSPSEYDICPPTATRQYFFARTPIRAPTPPRPRIGQAVARAWASIGQLPTTLIPPCSICPSGS